MVNKCAASKYTSSYASNEKKQIGKFHFSLKNQEFISSGLTFQQRDIIRMFQDLNKSIAAVGF